MSIAEQGRRRLRVFAIGIALLFGALAFSNYWTTRDNLREGSKVVSQTPKRLRPITAPTSYRAVFRVENRARELTVTVEKVWMKRPFQSRIETYKGTSGKGTPIAVRQ